ncbi:MAG: hypothetical protein AAGB46_18060 [Verrucomicrobiota bacterium]
MFTAGMLVADSGHVFDLHVRRVNSFNKIIESNDMKKLLTLFPRFSLFMVMAILSFGAATAQADDYRADYDALIEAQGDYAYAFDFFTV